MENFMLFDCRKLNKALNIDGSDYLEIDESLWKINGSSGCAGELNGFYGKKHTEETKQILREKTLKLCENPAFRDSRAQKGENNPMYGSKRFGELNPMYGKNQSEKTKELISLKAKERYKNGFINPNKGIPKTQEQKKMIAERNSKIFTIRHPNGNIIEIKNLADYCRTNDLNEIMMSRVSRGMAKKHKGYTTP